MVNRVSVEVDVHHGALAEMARAHDTRELVLRVAEDIAEGMRAGAPVRTGAGRASIRAHAEMGSDGWYATASWDERHYYMGIQNTRRHFAEPALSRVRYV